MMKIEPGTRFETEFVETVLKLSLGKKTVSLMNELNANVWSKSLRLRAQLAFKPPLILSLNTRIGPSIISISYNGARCLALASRFWRILGCLLLFRALKRTFRFRLDISFAINSWLAESISLSLKCREFSRRSFIMDECWSFIPFGRTRVTWHVMSA